MGIKVHMLAALGMAATNGFIVGDEDAKSCVIIDAPEAPNKFIEMIDNEGWKLKAILATHAHWDHVLAVRAIKVAYDAPFYLHEADMPILNNLVTRYQQLTGRSTEPAPPPNHFLQPGTVLEFDAMRFEVRFTPGHTPGHVSFVLHDHAVIFSGDCLFEGGVGRTDIPMADHSVLMESIFTQILTLPDDFTVACGHGRTTTIGKEKQSNPFVLEWMQHP